MYYLDCHIAHTTNNVSNPVIPPVVKVFTRFEILLTISKPSFSDLIGLNKKLHDKKLHDSKTTFKK